MGDVQIRAGSINFQLFERCGSMEQSGARLERDMSQTRLTCIAPCFVVRDVPATLVFFRDQLGFEITFQGPEPNDIFFGIVQRGGAMIMLKAIGVEPIPNYTRDIKKGHFPWDAYIHTPEPDALAAEFASRNIQFLRPIGNNSDNLRGFEIQDPNGYVLYFGCPNVRLEAIS